MTEAQTSPELDTLTDQECSTDGVITELGELPPGAIVTEAGLGRIFHRHKVSIKRAIERGELPPSVRLFGEPVWTANALLDHLARRLGAAEKETERMQRKISELGA